MYKILKIGGKEYRLEYTIEASLYDECVEQLIDFLGKYSSAAEIPEMTKGLDNEQKVAVAQGAIKDFISGVSNLPKTALTIFYAGLMEHHGIEGDNTVRSMRDAKAIVKQYFSDHAEDGTDNFYDLLTICIEQMGEDGFFKRIGLKKALSPRKPKKQTKKPEDFKKAGEA